MNRRGVLAGATVLAAAAMLPSPWASPAITAARLPDEATRLRVSLAPLGPFPSRVNWCQRIFEKAALVYETTGEPEELQRARWTLYWKLGFLMARIPNSPPDKLEQIRGFQLLETVAVAYPEVPWKVDLAARMESYRAWGCERGRTWGSV